MPTRVPPRRDGGQGDLSIMTRCPMTLTMLGHPTPAARSMRIIMTSPDLVDKWTTVVMSDHQCELLGGVASSNSALQVLG